MSKTNVLVTGGTGLVGTGLQAMYQKFNAEYNEFNFIFVSSKDANLTNYDETVQLFQRTNPQIVIHCAAAVGGLYKNMNEKVYMFETNVLMNMNIIKCCHQFNIQKCISCLSTCIFPDKINYPITETQLHDGPPHNSNDAYAYAKRFIDIHNKAYNENYGRNYFCVIPCNIYGKNDNFSLTDAHVIPALIHKCYLNKKNNKPFVVRGSGTPLRQFIYNEDLAFYLLKIMKYYNKNDNIILSSSESDEVSIKHVAQLIAQNFDYEEHMVFDTKYSDGQYKKTVSNNYLDTLFGPLNFTNIEHGIKNTIQWFIQNYQNVRK